METVHTDDDDMARAKASLMARMDELGKRFKSAKHTLDIEAHIAEHPLLAAGIALAAGLLLGSLGGPRVVGNSPHSPTPHPRVGPAPARGFLATLALAAVKELVVSQASGYAKSLFDPPKS